MNIKKLIVIPVALAAIGIAACGGTTTKPATNVAAAATTATTAPATATMTAAELEKSIEQTGDFQGAYFTDLTCVQATASTWNCIGNWHATLKSVHAEYGNDPDYASWDKQAIIKSEAGRKSFTVTVAADGSWVTS